MSKANEAFLAQAPPPPLHPGLGEGHVSALDPRSDGRKATLEAGDCVVLVHDPTRRMGCVTGLELSPRRAAEVLVVVAWPDPYDRRGYALTRHVREEVFYVGYPYPASLGLPHPAAPVKDDVGHLTHPPVSADRIVNVIHSAVSVGSGTEPHHDDEVMSPNEEKES